MIKIYIPTLLKNCLENNLLLIIYIFILRKEYVCMYVSMYNVDGNECIEFYYFACISSDSARFVYLYILIDIK